MPNGKGRERHATGRCGPTAAVVCVGGLVVDRTYRALGPVRPGTSNPVTGARSLGGVAGNVAVNLARLDVAASLVSMVGDDESGRALWRHAEELGIDTRGIGCSSVRTTAEYIALLDVGGDLALGMADMAIFDELDPARLCDALGQPGSPQWIFADCNLPTESLAWLLQHRRGGPARLAIDVVSVQKAERLPHDLDGLDLLFLNRDEASALLDRPAHDLEPADAIAGLLRRGPGAVVLTLGTEGLALGTQASIIRIAACRADVVNVTGAGDALVGTTLAYLSSGSTLAEAARFGVRAAALTVSCPDGTHPGLSRERLEDADSNAAAP